MTDEKKEADDNITELTEDLEKKQKTIEDTEDELKAEHKKFSDLEYQVFRIRSFSRPELSMFKHLLEITSNFRNLVTFFNRNN